MMMGWMGRGASLLALLWCSILEGVLLVLIGVISPFWTPLPLYRARDAITGKRRNLLLLRSEVNDDGGGGGNGTSTSITDDINSDSNSHGVSKIDVGGDDSGYWQKSEAVKNKLGKSAKSAAAAAAAAAAVESVPDLGRRYLDFLGQALGQSRGAAAAAATAPYGQDGHPRYGGGQPDSFFVDVSAYDEIILTTELEADGFLAACMLFGMVSVGGAACGTAEIRKGTERSYPLRTVIVPEGKAAEAREAIAAMHRTELIPSSCHVEVLEESQGYGDPTAMRSKSREGSGGVGTENDEEEAEDRGEHDARRSFFGACSTLLLRSPVLRAIFGRWGRLSGEWQGVWRKDLARTKLREVFSLTRRQNQRVLVIALMPPRGLTQVLLEGGEGVSWWRTATGLGGRESPFGHVDLFVSGGFSGGGVFAGPEDGEPSERSRWQPRRSRLTPRTDGGLFLRPRDVEEAMTKVNRVFVVQLDDLVRSYGFPRAIAPDRTPTLSAAMAGARGVLPSRLRRVIAASNHSALTEFPGKVTSAISAGRYANEDLRVRASSIAAAAAVAEQPGMGGGRAAWAELGARMADLIASDFEALEAAGLSPGTQQAVFRSLDVGMGLSDVAAAWALVCQDAVCWEGCTRIGVYPLRRCGERERRGGQGVIRHHAQGKGIGRSDYDGYGGYHVHDVDDFKDGGESQRGTGFKRGKGDARGCRGQLRAEVVDRLGGDGDFSGNGCGSVSGGFVATGFADGFKRLEDQEAGYASFAAFLVRVLDQMP